MIIRKTQFETKRFRIRVRWKHILHSSRMNPEMCMVANATREATGLRVSFGVHHAAVFYEWYTYDFMLPYYVSLAIMIYMTFGIMFPFSFSLDIPVDE